MNTISSTTVANNISHISAQNNLAPEMGIKNCANSAILPATNAPKEPHPSRPWTVLDIIASFLPSLRSAITGACSQGLAEMLSVMPKDIARIVLAVICTPAILQKLCESIQRLDEFKSASAVGKIAIVCLVLQPIVTTILAIMVTNDHGKMMGFILASTFTESVLQPVSPNSSELGEVAVPTVGLIFSKTVGYTFSWGVLHSMGMYTSIFRKMAAEFMNRTSETLRQMLISHLFPKKQITRPELSATYGNATYSGINMATNFIVATNTNSHIFASAAAVRRAGAYFGVRLDLLETLASVISNIFGATAYMANSSVTESVTSLATESLNLDAKSTMVTTKGKITTRHLPKNKIITDRTYFDLDERSMAASIRPHGGSDMPMDIQDDTIKLQGVMVKERI